MFPGFQFFSPHFRSIIPQFTSKLKVSHSSTYISLYLYLEKWFAIKFYFFTSTVELNEIGFKFVRKCINYIETKGKGSYSRLICSCL